MSNVKVSREISSAAGGLAVTASDTTIFDPPGRGLYVGVTGNVAVRMAGDGSTLPQPGRGGDDHGHGGDGDGETPSDAPREEPATPPREDDTPAGTGGGALG